MPRKARITVEGAVHHIMSRGIEGTSIFLGDEDRRMFLDILESLLVKSGYLLYAWCLMDNHYHLLIRVNSHPLGRFMRLLNGLYAQYFRKKTEKLGYLFQDRYRSMVTQDQRYIEEMVRYIHLNPVRAGICRTLDELGKYPWSGHQVILGKKKWGVQNIHDVLNRFSSNENNAREKYLEFLQSGLGIDDETTLAVRKSNRQAENIFQTGCWVIGNREFVTKALAAAKENRARIARCARENVAIEDIAGKISSKYNLASGEILRRSRDSTRSRARKEFAFVCTQEYHFSVAAVAAFLGISSPSVSALVSAHVKNTGEIVR